VEQRLDKFVVREGISMNASSESENRFLDVSEKEMVSVTRSPKIEQQSIEQLRALTHRLRQAHGRAQDISARQQREIRGKGDPRGAKRVQDKRTPSQAELSRRALELKMSSQTVEHPDPGRSASEGMHPKKRKELFKVGTTRKEIGRVSQAGKVAQARKDSKS
jgi:hypothetical protein